MKGAKKKRGPVSDGFPALRACDGAGVGTPTGHRTPLEAEAYPASPPYPDFLAVRRGSQFEEAGQSASSRIQNVAMNDNRQAGLRELNAWCFWLSPLSDS